MQRELEWLHADKGGLVRWLRLRPPFMPIVTFIYCLFGNRLHSQNVVRAPAYGR